MDWKDIAVRAAKTAAQTFLAVIIPALNVGTVTKTDAVVTVLITAGIAALAAGLSIVNNALIAAIKS